MPRRIQVLSFHALLVLSLALTSTVGCGPDEALTELADMRAFEGAEVEALLEETPDTTFFVDLRGDTVYSFDQQTVELDFDSFLVQCPTMPAPMPMPAFLTMLGIDATTPYWTLMGDDAQGPDSDFRGLCVEVERHCPNGQDKGDCVWVCVLELDDDL